MTDKEAVKKVIKLFIENNCVIKSGAFIIGRDFLNRCKLSSHASHEVLNEMGVIKCRIFTNNKQQRCYYGIEWKDNIK